MDTQEWIFPKRALGEIFHRLEVLHNYSSTTMLQSNLTYMLYTRISTCTCVGMVGVHVLYSCTPKSDISILPTSTSKAGYKEAPALKFRASSYNNYIPSSYMELHVHVGVSNQPDSLASPPPPPSHIHTPTVIEIPSMLDIVLHQLPGLLLQASLTTLTNYALIDLVG